MSLHGGSIVGGGGGSIVVLSPGFRDNWPQCNYMGGQLWGGGGLIVGGSIVGGLIVGGQLSGAGPGVNCRVTNHTRLYMKGFSLLCVNICLFKFPPVLVL